MAARSTAIPATMTFYEGQRALNEKQQLAQFERQQAMLAKEIKFIERFKARASHASQVQSRVKKLDKIDRVEPPKRRQTVSFDFLPAPRSGEDVVIIKNVNKKYGSRVIYEGLDFVVRRKERWCIMGINGAGKSTLLKLVTGSTNPDEGSVALGASVKMGYFAQHAMDILDGETHRASRCWKISSRGRARHPCALWPAVSVFPATMSRNAAGCFRAVKRRDW